MCKLDKALYRLKQAPQALYDKLKWYLLELQFQRSAYDVSLFHRKIDGTLVLILVYVDDILITGSSTSQILEVIQLLNIQFALKHPRLVHYFLGIEVTYSSHSYPLSQAKYILMFWIDTTFLL